MFELIVLCQQRSLSARNTMLYCWRGW